MKRMMACLIAAAFVCATAQAAQISLQNVKIDDWSEEGSVKKVVGKALYDLIDGFADIHMGFAFLDSEHVTLKKGKAELEVSVFRVDSTDNGFGLYSCLRDRAEGKPFDAGVEASYAYGTAIIWAGPYVIEVKDISEEPAPDEDIIAAAKQIAAAYAGPRPKLPELIRAYPKEKLVDSGMIYFHHRHPFDQVYYLGSENPLQIGLDAMKPSGLEAAYASYKLPKGVQGVLALRYKKPDVAAKALDDYTKMLADQLQSTEKDAPWVTLTAKNGKQTLAYLKDRVLILAFESSQVEPTQQIVTQIAKNLEPKKKPQKPEKK